MARAFDFSRQFALAARAVASLTAWFDFTRLGDIATQGLNVFIVKTLAVWTVTILFAPSPFHASGSAAPWTAS